MNLMIWDKYFLKDFFGLIVSGKGVPVMDVWVNAGKIMVEKMRWLEG